MPYRIHRHWAVMPLFLAMIMAPSFPAQARDLYIPHLTTGEADWSDHLEVDNTGPTSAEFTLTLYDATGAEVYEQAHSVPSLGESVSALKDLAPSARCGRIGTESNRLFFRVAHRNTLSGGVAEFALSEELGSGLGFFFSDVSPSVSWKGIALANLSDEPLSVTLYALGGGRILDHAGVSLGAYQKTHGVHSQWFPGIALSDIRKIVAVSASWALSGIAISGNADSSQLLFTRAEPLTEFNPADFTVSDVSGDWSGTWTSTKQLLRYGDLKLHLTQMGSDFTGTADISDTDCGDITGAPGSGTVSGNDVTFGGTYPCDGWTVTLSFTEAIVAGNSVAATMTGKYEVVVGGEVSDKGGFLLTRFQ